MKPPSPVPLTTDEQVSRILTWSGLGCALVCEDGRWRLDPPETMPAGRGPCPRKISDAVAREAIRRGARSRRIVDLFGPVPVAADVARAA